MPLASIVPCSLLAPELLRQLPTTGLVPQAPTSAYRVIGLATSASTTEKYRLVVFMQRQ